MIEIGALLDELAYGIAAVLDDDAGVQVAARVVCDLEHLAGAELGDVDGNGVLVARRFARVHRMLLHAPPTAELVDRLNRHLVAVGDPFAATPVERSPASCGEGVVAST